MSNRRGYSHGGGHGGHGGGGGGHRGGGGRRSGGYEFQGGYGGGGYDAMDTQYHEQPQEVETNEMRILTHLSRVGDKADQMVPSLEALASLLDNEIRGHADLVVSCVLECVLEAPFKTPLFATLVGLVKAAHTSFAQAVVDSSLAQLAHLFNEPAIDERAVRLLVRFFAELCNSNVIAPAALVQLLTALLDACAQEGSTLFRTDFLLVVVCSALPWVGATLSKYERKRLDALMERIGELMDRRDTSVIRSVSLFENDEGEEVADLWGRVRDAAINDWAVAATLKPYAELEAKLGQWQPCAMEPFVVPAPLASHVFHPRPLVRFFPAEASEADMSPIDWYVARELVRDYLNMYEVSHRDAVHLMISLPLPFRFEVLMAEVVIAELLRLPKPEHTTLYYSVVFCDLCRAITTIPPAMAHVMFNIADRLDTMDPETVDRAVGFLSYHLSNFGFAWPWAKWEDVLELDFSSRRFAFVYETLDHCIRLSYHQRIKSKVPASFVGKVLPPEPKPVFKFADLSVPGASVARALVELMRKREAPAVVHSTLEEARDLSDVQRADVLLQSVLFCGAKSFTHVLNVMERYFGVLRDHVYNEDTRVAAMNAVREVWVHSSQFTTIILDKLMTYRLIADVDIVRWLFSADVRGEFTHAYAWDVLNNAVNKTVTLTNTVQRDMDLARNAPEGAALPASVEQIESKLVSVQQGQRELFVLAFELFAASLGEHLTAREAAGDSPYTAWYHCMRGRMKQLGRTYLAEVREVLHELEDKVFGEGVDKRISVVFEQIKDLL